MTYVVLARWTAREGEEEALADVIAKMVEPSRAEAGCIVYRPHRDVDEPRAFLLYEEYTDKAAYQAHAASEHFQEYAVGQGFPLLESRERSFYEPV